MRLWDLPGARRFVEAACDSLRAGHNVVASFPGTIPDGFDNAVSVMIGNTFRLDRLSGSSTPLDDLRQYAAQPTHIHSAADLCEDAGFRGRLVQPYGLDAHSWLAWRDFLATYAQASRSRPLVGRSLFLLAGCPGADEPVAEVGVVDLAWDGSVDNVDLLLFANEKLRERTPNPLMRSLLANTVARVAAWDYDTAANLLDENDETIMDPTALLRAEAEERNWTTDTPLDWRLGTANRSGIAHPARASVDDPPLEIERRIWSAQLAVLLPWIEERRHDVVADNLYDVKQQMRIDGDGQGDPYDIEVGDLYALLARRGGSRGIRKRVQRLRDGRNVLAHRQRLPRDAVMELLASWPA